MDSQSDFQIPQSITIPMLYRLFVSVPQIRYCSNFFEYKLDIIQQMGI